MAIKLKKLNLEKILSAVCMLVFLIALTVQIQSILTYDYYPVVFAIMFISLIGLFITGIKRIFYKWAQMDQAEVDDNQIKTRIYKLQAVLIPYYLISIFVLNFFKRDGYRTFAEDLMSYNNLTHLLWFIYLIIPLSYEMIAVYYIVSYYGPKERQLRKLKQMLNQLSEGNLEMINSFDEKESFFQYGKKLVDFSNITSRAIESSLRDEKTKIELITNVSHDLKTPLTSMIGYIDLMKKEELTDVMKDYVDGISEKSEKLKEMIQSMFDLAKTASGNAELNIEKLDINRLITQILADMDDVIKSNEKIIKLSLTEANTEFEADSAAMYRVCQNLIENAIKYSLNGSRIIITTLAEEGKLILTVKNVANYEMDFTEDEIVERFTRADKARSTDGNGLGLAIAKTYTEACKGHFQVKIEDDIFIAQVSFLG